MRGLLEVCEGLKTSQNNELIETVHVGVTKLAFVSIEEQSVC